MNLLTLNDVFFTVVERDARMVTMQRGAAGWISTSSQEFYRNVTGVMQALEQWGISPGDRVAILAENRPEWTIADFACLLSGAVVVPVYPTLTVEQTAYLLNDSGARVAFVSSEAQLQKIAALREQTSLEKIVVMDAVSRPGAIAMDRLMRSGQTQRDPALDARARAVRPSDLATIIYTSGTTGVPKGAMLTHGNMASNIAHSLKGYDLGPGDLSISFLPLSHVTARHLDLAMLHLGVVLAYVASPDQLAEALLHVRPTIFVGVPRVYEKICAQVRSKAKGFPKGWIYHWAVKVGRMHRATILAGKIPQSAAWRLAHRLVYSKVRAGMGGQNKFFISGGAPLGRELAEWYADLGIRIHEGYGLTETSPVLALNRPDAHKLGTVGKPLANVELRIAEDGEILARGPSVFKSYWNGPAETEQAFAGSWFKTGDIGNLDAEGFLSVTDRKRDLIKTSGGKFVAPQPIENSLKHNPLISEAVILGEKRNFCSVLIAPHFPALKDWCEANHISFSSQQEVVAHPRVRALYEGIVAELNRELAQFEKLKKVLLVAEAFSTENGLLTASMKLRRRAVAEHYRERIEQMYEEGKTAGQRSSK
jgi:long-chain acyl-CoA synthetase